MWSGLRALRQSPRQLVLTSTVIAVVSNRVMISVKIIGTTALRVVIINLDPVFLSDTCLKLASLCISGLTGTVVVVTSALRVVIDFHIPIDPVQPYPFFRDTQISTRTFSTMVILAVVLHTALNTHVAVPVVDVQQCPSFGDTQISL